MLSLLKRTPDKIINNLQGTILNNDGNYYSNWGLPTDLKVTQEFYVIGDFNNGTMYLIAQEDEFSWKISSSNLPRISNGKQGKNFFLVILFNQKIHSSFLFY